MTPPSLDREALAAWAFRLFDDTRIAASSSDTRNHNAWRTLADAIRALVEAKVREAVDAGFNLGTQHATPGRKMPPQRRAEVKLDAVARIMGDAS